MVQAVKITSLNNIGTSIMYTTLVPVVNMTGTPTTEKANLQIVGNLILSGAGGSYFPPAAQATISQFVAYAAQPNITSVGTLTSLAVSGNINAGNANLGNLAIANVFSGSLNGSAASANTANTANTVTLNAQPNITSLGTLTSLNVTGLANLGAVTNIIITGGSPNYVLQTNGNGTLSWAAQTGGSSNANIGNITFNNANISTDLLNTDIQIIGNGTGDVNIAANGQVWTFNADGNLTTPGNIILDNIGDANISSDANININAAGNIWQFGADGDLTTPGNIILDNIGDANISSDANININAAGNIWQFGADGDLTTPGNIIVDVVGDANISSDANININSAGNIWQFGADGDLTTPGNIIVDVVGDANISSDANININAAGNIWSFASDGKLTFPGTPRIDTSTNNFEVQAAEAINFEANTVVNIYTDSGNNAYQWQFGDDGNLTLPDTTSVLANVNITLEANDTGNITGLNLIGDSNANLYAHGNVKIVSDSSNTTATWTFDATGNLTAPGSIINDTSIVLSAPAIFNICTIATAGSEYNTGSSLKATTGGSGTGMTVGIGYGLSNQLTSVSVVDPGTGYVNGDVITVSEGTGGTFVITKYNVLANQTNNNTVQTDLIFANNTLTIPAGGNLVGNLIVPGSIVSSGASPAPYISGFSSITLAYGAKIKDTSSDSVSFGQNAGNASQGSQAVAIGLNAGANGQANGAVALGVSAGQLNQGITGIAIGDSAGSSNQGLGAVAIGAAAGFDSQGQYSVAMGYYAGYTSQANNSIILNATGANLNQTVANTFTVAPVRNDVANIAQVMFYNTTSKEVTYGNTISVAGNIAGNNISATGNITGAYVKGNGSQLTSVSTSFDLEMHVSKDGNDSTGTGTILRPYLTITHALTQVTGGRNTIVIHPGTYTENPTITSQATQIITYDATGASTLVVGTVTIANVTGRIAGLKMTNLAITGNAQAYINSSTVDGQFTKSSSGYVEVSDCELQVTGNVLISGSGVITIVGNKIDYLVVNNAGASVLVKGADDCVMPQVTAGSLNIVDSIIRASSNTANAVTASAGTVVTLMNNQIVTPAADSVARVSIAGYHSIISVVYDKANSTLSNSLNSVVYFQTANVDSLVSSGNITTTGNITGNTNGFTIGYLNIPQVAAANATLALTDAGKHYYSTSAGNFTLTIPNNATTTFATGTAISIVVQATGNVLVNAASGVTLYMAGNSTAANRVVSNYGMATLMKVNSDTWMISGTGVA